METSPIPNSPSSDAITGSGSSRGIVSMMLGVSTSPAQTFADFCKSPSILIPLVTVMVLAGLGGALTVKQSSMVQYDMFKISTNFPMGVVEEMRQDALTAGPVKGMIGPVLGVLIGGLVGALIA